MAITIPATGGNDTIDQTTSIDNLIVDGLAGDDSISTGTGADSIFGNAGRDSLFGGTGNDTIDGGDDNDTINGGIGTDSIVGGSGADSLSGSNGNDTIIGGDGNDTLYGGADNDSLVGGEGSDTYIVESANDILNEAGTTGTDTIKTSLVAYDLTSANGNNIENIEFVGVGNFTVKGNDLNNLMKGAAGLDSLSGGLGGDTLLGFAGNDVLTGGLGSDSLDGGEGSDLYIYNSADELAGAEIHDSGATLADKDEVRFVAASLGANNVLQFAAGDTGIERIVIGTGTAASAVTTGTLALGIDASQLINSVSMTGNAGNNTLAGGAGGDTITGGAGNDTLDGGAGSNSLIGGLGNDTYIIHQLSDLSGVVESNATGAAEGSADALNIVYANSGAVQTINLTITSLVNIENVTVSGVGLFNITGNAIANSLAGNVSANSIAGGLGNDSLNGDAGNDTLDGGVGNDTLDGGTGDDTLIGGDGNDTYVVDSVLDVVSETSALAAGGIDTVKTTLNAFDLSTNGINVENLTYASSADFTGAGNSSNNLITSGTGNDSLKGNAGNDTLNAGEGNDTLDGGLGSDSLVGGAGNDTYSVNLIKSGTVAVLEDTISDTLGSDTLQLHSATLVLTSATTLTLASTLENLDASDTGSTQLNLTGNTTSNQLTGNAANNTLDGGANLANLGGDTLVGGAGNDTYIVRNVSDVVKENVSEGTDTIKTALTTFDMSVSAANVENFVFTGTTATKVTVTGNDQNNSITGGIGADSLSGGAGDDTLVGGAGIDTLSGGDGSDTFMLDQAAELANISDSAGQDTLFIGFTNATTKTVILDLATIGGGGIENITVTATGLYNLQGNSLNNILVGNAAANSIAGGQGDDSLFGGAGNDTLAGESGNNTLVGGDGNDTYYIGASDTLNEVSAAGGIDTVITAIDNYTLGANLENLVLTGSTGLRGIGNSLANNITGSTGSDSLDGSTGKDTLVGGAGDDTYLVDLIKSGTVAALEDTITDTQGVDTLQLRSSTIALTTATTLTLAATLENLDASNTGATLLNLTGNLADNQLKGNDANNILDGGLGKDTLIGGLGNDTYIVDIGDVVIENAGDGTGTDTIKTNLLTFDLEANGANVENLVFTGTAAFTGSGNALNNSIVGGAGKDTLTGGEGNNTLDGGLGADSLSGGSGNDRYLLDNVSDVVSDTGGNDTAVIGFATATSKTIDLNTFMGGVFENVTVSGTGAYSLTGNDQDNLLIGNTSANTILGGKGNDTIDGGAGADSMNGGEGNDVYIVDNALDKIIDSGSTSETNTIKTGLAAFDLTKVTNIQTLIYTGAAKFSATGSVKNDSIIGGAVGDSLNGGAGEDTLDGGLGADTLVGGLGNDTFIVDNALDVVTELAIADSGIDTIKTNLATFDLSLKTGNVENLVYTGVASFSGKGNALANSLVGGAGNDTLDGKANTDTTTGDTLVGGDGNDVYIINSLKDLIVETQSGGFDTIKTNATTFNLNTNAQNVENLSYTGTGAFTGIGNTADNSIVGGIGNDSLSGDTGNDTLDGGLGTNTLEGGAGNDLFIVRNAQDVITEQLGDGIDTIQTNVLSYDMSLVANVENLTFTGVGNFSGVGNALANSLIGGIGNDTLDGGSGDDTLSGGAGNDTYIIDSLNDMVIEGVSGGTDTLFTSLATIDISVSTLGTNIENLTFKGTGSFNAIGNALNNNIQGGSGNDTLDGGIGDDTLVGGLGDDTYIVDSANDSIVEAADGGIDTVKTTNTTYDLSVKATNVDALIYTGTSNFIGTGNALNNTLVGGIGNDSLSGDLGNDTFTGSGGNDTFVGGDGDDTYFVDSATDVITEVLSGGTDTINTALTNYDMNARALNVEVLNYIGNGNFAAIGNYDNNTISGSNGNDTLDGGLGADSFIGGSGNDTYIIDNVGDTVSEGGDAGTDTVKSSLLTFDMSKNAVNVENFIFTSNVSFSVIGNNSNNSIIAGAGNDTLDGGSGDDTLIGDGGSDTYFVDSAGDQVVEAVNSGEDTIKTTLNSFDLNVKGINVEDLAFIGTGNFNGVGNASNNSLIGGSGDDTLNGGGGADTLIGGAGNDSYVISDAGDVIVETVVGGTDSIITTLTSFDMNISAANVENLTYTGNSNFSVEGNSSDNNISSGAGNDMLDGGTGSDTLSGGAGDDVYWLDNLGDQVVEQSNSGNDTINTTLTTFDMSTMGVNVENLKYQGELAFVGAGNALNNSMLGGSGDDSLSAGLGDDTLDGGAGSNTLSGGQGNDVYIYHNNDTVIEASGAGNDTLVMDGDIVGGNLQPIDLSESTSVKISNVEVFNITGTAGNTLILSAASINAMTDNNHTLTVIGDASDTVRVTDNVGWVKVGTVSINGADFTQYTNSNSNVTLNVSAGMIQDDILPASNNINLSSLTGTTGFKISGASGEEAGFSVHAAGDVNGDGFDDVIIGAPSSSNSAGAGYVVFGKASGFGANFNLSTLTSANGFKISGGSAGDATHGMSVSTAGDINRDGFDDLIIGTSDVNGGDGASYVIFGKASGFENVNLSSLSPSAGFKIIGNTYDRAGVSVSAAGDVNGDGFEDIVVGAPFAGNYAGAAYVVFGKASGFGTVNLSTLSASAGIKITESSTDYAGRSVSNAGDVNGDGIDDIIIGAYKASPNGNQYAGASYVVFGSNSLSANIDLGALNGTNGFKISGLEGLSGKAVSNAGDVNGDGIDDVIIGAPIAGANANGAAYVVFGSKSAFSANINVTDLNGSNGFKLSGVSDLDTAGFSVSNAGDVNGDGFDDLIIGAPKASNNGVSYLVFGHDGGFAANIDLSSLDGTNGIKLTGAGSGDQAGISVSSAGDVNRDGYDDLIIGASSAGGGNGTSYVLFGKDFSKQFTQVGTNGADSINGTVIADYITGGLGNDTISANNGDDTVYGGAGGDKLLGGLGNDVLRGGDGADIFVFDTTLNAATNVDTITDFHHGVDQIQLQQTIFAALGVGSLNATNFHSGTGAPNGLDANDFIYYDKSSGSLYYDADGNGAGAAVKFAVLSTHPGDLSASDFNIV